MTRRRAAAFAFVLLLVAVPAIAQFSVGGSGTGGGGGGGATPPGGSNTYIQFNDGSVFNGDGCLTFDKVTGRLTTCALTVTGPGAGFTEWLDHAMTPGATGTIKCGSNAGVFSCSVNGGATTVIPVVTPTDDQVLVGSGTLWQGKAIPNCTDTGGNHLNYTAATNSFSCGTTGDGAGAADLSGAVALTGDITPAALTANTHNWDPPGLATASSIRVSTDTQSRNITGIVGGTDGRILIIHNVGSFMIALRDEDGASTAANRFALGLAPAGLDGIAIQPGGAVMVQYDTTSQRWRAVSAAPTPFIEPGLRITLTTGVSVPTADVSGATTIRYTPHSSGSLVVWNHNGTAMFRAVISEITLAASGATGEVKDVFVSCTTPTTCVLSQGPAWTDPAAGTRAEGIATQSGIGVRSAVPSALWVGTVRYSGTNTIDDTAAKRGVWNRYNRVRRPMGVTDTTNTWDYSTTTCRQANGSGANQVEWVTGDASTTVSVDLVASVFSATMTVAARAGIGIDSTTVMSGRSGLAVHTADGAGSSVIAAYYKGQPGLGVRTAKWLECGGGGTTTWYGDNGGASETISSGLSGELDN